MKIYRIKDWNLHFEKAQSRKCQEMKWVAIPNKHAGKTYRRLTTYENWIEIFGAWILLLEVASKCPTHGVLADDDGALSVNDLELMTGCPADVFTKSLKVLANEHIGWIEVIDSG